MCADNVEHECTLWGIRFPFAAAASYYAVKKLIEEYLVTDRHPVLNARKLGLDLTAIIPAVKVKTDWEIVEHM